MRANHKVSTTAAASNKQGNVELLKFDLDGSDNLVMDISICCDHIGNITVNNGHLNGCKPMTISRNVLGSKSGSSVLIMLLLVRRLHL